jgi:hypothetical protein
MHITSYVVLDQRMKYTHSLTFLHINANNNRIHGTYGYIRVFMIALIVM